MHRHLSDHHHFFPTHPPPHNTVPPCFLKGASPNSMHGSRSETCPFSAPRIQPSPHFGRRQTHAMMMHKNMDQNEDHQRHHRSPSIDSVSRLHQQSGGFAGHQRRGSFSSKENGVGGGGGFYHPHHHNNGGFRRQNYNQRGRHNQQRDYHSGQYHQQTTSSEYSQQNMFNNGYQPKSQNRSYQNYPPQQHQSKYQYYHNHHHQNLNSNSNSNSSPLHIAAANQQPQRPIFNSTNDRNFAAEFGAFSSFRRPSPSTPPSPNGTAASGVVPRHLEESPLVRRTTDRQSSPAEKMLTSSGSGVTHELEQQQQHEKIHMYRAAGTAPGGYSTGSSPFKMSPTQPPSTPSADKNAEEWQRQFQMPPPQSTFQQFRRGPHEQQTMELQLKTAEVLPISLPTTPSAVGGTQFRAAMKDAPMTRSVDSVDAKHPCFSDERMHSALIGVSPQVKTQHQPPGMPILNDREASITMEEMQKLHLQHQHQQQQQQQHFQMHRGATAVYQPYAFTPAMFPALPERQMKGPVLPTMMKIGGGEAAANGEKLIPHRDSSTTSRSSSRVDHEATKEDADKLDDCSMVEPPSCVDLDKTPCGTDETKVQKDLPARKSPTRRDSESTSVSLLSTPSDSPANGVDESTLTKILPTDEFRGGRGVASPGPPASLVSEPLSRMDVLSEKIWDYHNKVAQTDEMLQRKLHLRDMLYTAISPVFPMSGLYVVGSSLNGFGNNSSDMDLCLMITNKDLDQKNDAVVVLNLILSTLQYEKFVASQKLILAKVPILRIKFAAPFDDITVDLNANNSVAIRNTHLLCYYSSYDWRVRPLVSVVKEWAKRKGINDANKSSFTSYSLVLMVIHYLQCGTTPKVLPNLQQTYPDRFSNKVDVRTLNVTMPLDQKHDNLEQTSPSEKTTLGELLIGFLDYYANRFDYDHDAISIRQGQRVERAALAARPKMHTSGDKETPPPSSSASSSSLHNNGNNVNAGALTSVMMHHAMSNPHFWRSQWRCVCIEEPFTNSNTAHSIYDEMVFGAIKEAFREAHGELQHNHDLDRLMECEPIKASITNAGAAVFAATYEGERPQAQQPNSIATASLRAMNVMGPGTPVSGGPPVGHFHFQQQQSQVLKQQRSNNQQQNYHMNSHRNNSSNNAGHRRSYQQNGGSARLARSSESFNKETSLSRHQQMQRGGGGAKENVPEKKQHQQRREESSKTKRSPDSKSKQSEKTLQ